MEKIDDLINFLWNRRTDDRVTITKDKKYGWRNYYLNMTIDEEPDNDSNNTSSFPLRGIYGFSRGSLSIHIDNRNNCVNIHYGSNNIVIEDDTLVQKWGSIFEEYILSENDTAIDNIINRAFSDCYRKDFHRDWKMKKIFDDEDESL